jgi:multiple sugar transport system substrate-binding protein
MRGLRLITLAAIPALVLSACSSTSATPAASVAPGVTPTPVVPENMTVVRWFVGLGSGTQPNQIEAQKTFVKAYNESQSKIFINLEIVPNANAYDILKTEIAAGTAPDIIGPVGVRGRNGFSGVFLDLTTEIANAKYDTSKFPQALVDFFKQGGDGQVGLPYLIYPAFMFYNKDIFAQQSLPDLPKKVGEQWNGQDWTWETAAEIGKMVTVDKNGKKSTDAGFDKNNIVQFGFDAQWWDGRRLASAFGGGSFVADDGKTAQIPEAWAYGWKWYYDAMWKYSFAPTGKYRSSALLNQGTTVSSGRIAMDAANGWSINSYGTEESSKIKSWDMGVLPSYNGKTSGPLDADTFTIVKSSEHPSEAFEAMVAIMASKELQVVYGGMPAATADQAAFFTKFDQDFTSKVFPNVTISWDVLQEMQNYPAVPSHEADMPNFLKVIDLYNAFFTKLQSSAGLNVDNELNQLKADIQKAFDESAASPAA